MDDALISYLRLALSSASAVVYFYVGARLGRRRVGGDARLAAQLFSTWWILLGALTAGGIVQSMLALSKVSDLALYEMLVEVELLILVAAFWALLYYLSYVLTGSRRAMIPITAFYAGIFLWLLYIVDSIQYDRVDIVGATATLHSATTVDPTIGLVLLALLLGPVLVGAVGYVRLYFQVEGRTQRYRIGLVAATLVTWFGSSGLATVSGASKIAWWPLVSGLLGLAAAICIFFAYQPPGFIQRRFGIEAVS
ncbi:MAG: hypothetical protein QOE90_3566 [Thermoplasmata archaeon]|jgi:hypothetical protein|nr:hypothetical protein [Thermoplasmata archaeon]